MINNLRNKLLCVSDDLTAKKYIKLFGNNKTDQKPYRILNIRMKACAGDDCVK
jgi:hypothetical protein